MPELRPKMRTLFAEEIDKQPWICQIADHPPIAHKHEFDLKRWWYKPAPDPRDQR